MIGVRFGAYHTWDDWGIIRKKVTHAAPAVERYTTKVPGRNGLLDMTSAITPEPALDNKTDTYEFFVRPGNWTEILSEIKTRIHGRTLQVIDDIDPEYYWEGFCEYNEFESDERTGLLVITLDAFPFKLEVHETERKITGSGTIVCVNDRMPVVPKVVTTAETTIVFGTKSVTLAAGTHLVADLKLTEGKHTMTVTSTGTTTFKYRQGRL